MAVQAQVVLEQEPRFLFPLEPNTPLRLALVVLADRQMVVIRPAAVIQLLALLHLLAAATVRMVKQPQPVALVVAGLILIHPERLEIRLAFLHRKAIAGATMLAMELLTLAAAVVVLVPLVEMAQPPHHQMELEAVEEMAPHLLFLALL